MGHDQELLDWASQLIQDRVQEVLVGPPGFRWKGDSTFGESLGCFRVTEVNHEVGLTIFFPTVGAQRL